MTDHFDSTAEPSPPVSVVIATRNRADELVNTVTRLRALTPSPPVIVVDNDSEDHTVVRVRRLADPGVRLIRMPRNQVAEARNAGVAAATTPYVAFSDDDSWWDPGSLDRAAELFKAHPRLGLIAATTLVGERGEPDPVVAAMAASPLRRQPDDPGPAVLGFLACSAIVRVEAFRDAGGFSRLLHFGAEETLLAWDLAARGWRLCHVPEIVARHHPSQRRMAPIRRHRLEARNNALIGCMRRSPGTAAAGMLRLTVHGLRRPAMLPALAGAVTRLPAAMRHRRRLPAHVEDQIGLLRGTS
ncbi:GT2 family glycosyltransferase [Stackebrandtia albiflava]|uniref:GT2 family glycosyltransferase n=1 Tax=Stackebrandtia albiflava TaxID=406432 RepID=A0A562VA83_9ACTN|nr:glycosyltransferase [Stackebrandtia albiflava]TWJ14717.1 GT2 family glycosyltransferase [Stackebrandtia albiflava]